MLPFYRRSNPTQEVRNASEKGIALSKKAMQAIESRLERHPALPKWDILIRPASAP